MGDARRVLFFHAYPHQYAGAQRITHVLAEGLAARGWSTRVMTPDDGPFPARLREAGVDVQIVPAPRLWRRYGRQLEGRLRYPALALLPIYWARLAWTIRRWRPEIVHCNDQRGVLIAGLPARVSGARLVWHIHGGYEHPLVTRFGAWLANRVLVVSRATRSELPALERFADKVEVVHNGLPPPPAASERGDVPADFEARDPVLVTGARINPDKGLDVLIRATARLRQRYPNVGAFVAGHVQSGSEPHMRGLTALRRQLGVEREVCFLGALAEPLAAWAAADVYVQPSRVEPFGLGVVEAMALGVPVVATRTGGLTEVVEDGVSGLLVEPDDDQALADAIAQIVDDAELAKSLAAAGLERARAKFSDDAMLARISDIYARTAPEP